jgi:hypothetical protein
MMASRSGNLRRFTGRAKSRNRLNSKGYHPGGTRPGKNESRPEFGGQKRTYKGFIGKPAAFIKRKSLAVSQAEGRRGILRFAGGL